VCCHVLEHVDDDMIAMKEFYRVLKPRGWAILQVPIDYGRADTFEDSNITDPKERENYLGQCDHLRLYWSRLSATLNASRIQSRMY
jgi:ubiquinone/menaquinone biosynthesis C-methylase UbiE